MNGMGPRRFFATALSALALTTSYSMEQPVQAQDRSPASLAPADLTGAWRILAVDGKPVSGIKEDAGTTRTPSVSFHAGGYGGTAGCNFLGGQGLLDGGRYYTAPGPQTLMGCGGAPAAQETAWNAVFWAQPRVARSTAGQVTLTGGNHVLTLGERKPLAGDVEAEAPFLLAGTVWSLHQIDELPFPRESTSGAPTLAFDAATWRAGRGCAAITDNYRQADGAIGGGSAARSLGAAPCTGQARPPFEALASLLAAGPRYTAGPNGELLMAGGGHRVIGLLDAEATAARAPPLPGTWRAVSLDGRPLPAGWRLSVTAERYDLGTHCKPLAGAYVAADGLFYAAPLPTIDLGCPADQAAMLRRITQLLSRAPAVARVGAAVALSDVEGRLVLQREPRLVTAIRTEQAGAAVRGLFAITTINGQPVTGTPKPLSLQVSPGAFVVQTPCGRIGGISQVRPGDKGWFTDGDTGPRPGCAATPARQHRQLERTFNGPLRAVLAEDGTLLLAGHRQWLTGRREGR